MLLLFVGAVAGVGVHVAVAAVHGAVVVVWCCWLLLLLMLLL